MSAAKEWWSRLNNKGGKIVMLLLLGFAAWVLVSFLTNMAARHHGVSQMRVSAPQPEAADEPLEYKLAVLNTGTVVRQDDITIIRFRYLLN
jgi:hypothetical protein